MRKKITIRWVDASGNRVEPHSPGATKVREESAKYYAFNVPGQPPAVPLARSRSVSETLYARLMVAGESEAAGIAPRGRAKPLTDLLDEWAQVLLDQGNSDEHAAKYVSRCQKIFTARKWRYPREITPEGVQAELAARMRDQVEDIGPQTRNHYLTAVRAFVRWLAGRGRRLLAADLLDDIPMLSVEVDLRHARRALTAEELGRLLADTFDSGIAIRNLTAAQRHCVYSLACTTGFRAGELAGLTPAHFDLVKGQALIPARRGKNKKTTRQPLPADIVDLMRTYTQGLAADDRLFPGIWHHKAASMLKRDLARIGVAYQIETPDGPLFADFHALRHTYVSLLEQAGVSLRDAMQLARHTDPKLTLGRYAKSQEEALAREVQRLPLFGGNPTPIPEDAEGILVSWIVMGWCWLLSGGLLPGCFPEPNRSEPDRTKPGKGKR